ncbi:MAG: FAD-dependent oxidoreductase [Candidatus Spyradocola sp.]|jgi:glycine/D-amino acid oxidase-like deaminating enzyme
MRKADVVVCGGGLTGVAAAVQARRSGAQSVLLIEKNGYLGGMATAGLVQPFMTYCKEGVPRGEGGQLIFGIFEEILDRLEALGGLGPGRDVFDDECMKLVLQRLCAEAGVQLLLHAEVEQVHVKGERLAAVRISSASGIEFVAAECAVDATGDADVAYLCGVPCDKGRAADERCQPMTLCFRMAGVDRSRMPSRAEINALYDAARAQGRIRNPREDVLFFDTLHEDVIHFNTTRVLGADPVSVDDVTRAEQEAREQVFEMVAFLRASVPGFENAYLQRTAAVTGARDSRRIHGQYTLTVEEVLNQARFPDAVCRFAYMVDVHSPDGAGTLRRHLPKGGYYEIPFRCLVPKRVENLLVAGRTISADHEAQSSLRVMPACTAMGQAAGLACARFLRTRTPFAKMNGEKLHRLLVEAGAMPPEA